MASPAANRLALREVRADALNRPAFHGRAIPRLARRLIYQIRFGKTRRAEAEVDAAVRSNSHAERVNALLFAALVHVATVISASARSSPLVSTINASFSFAATNTPLPRA